MSLAFSINETLKTNIRYSFFKRTGVQSETSNSLLMASPRIFEMYADFYHLTGLPFN